MKGNRLRTLGFSIVGALALFLASCGQQPPPSNGGGNGGGGSQTGTLEVTVLNDANSQPIQGAVVTVNGAQIGVTNNQGKVSASLTPGQYAVNASATGFVTPSVPLSATVAAGQTTTLTIRLQPQAPAPGPGVCRPSGDTSYRTELVAAAGSEPAGIKSIQITGQRAGTYCFAAGVLELRIYLGQGEENNLQVILVSSDNPQATQVIPHRWQGSYFVATLDTRNQQIQGVPQRLIVKYQRGGNDIRDQVWEIVPDNLPPQVPDVRPVSAIDPVEASGPQPERWIGGPASHRVTLTLENQDLVDNPANPNLLASGIKEVRFFAYRVGGYRAEPRIGEGRLIGTARARPYQVEWNTRDGNWPDGKYYVYAVAEDWMGNYHPHPGTPGAAPLAGFYVNVDNTAPSVRLTVQDRGVRDVGRAFNTNQSGLGYYLCDNPTYTWGDGRIDIFPAESGFVSGCASVTYSAGDTGVGLGNGNAELSWAAAAVFVPEGTNITYNINVNDLNGPVAFVLKAKDRLGNESQAQVQVTVDNRRPEVDLLKLYLPSQPSQTDPDVVLAGSQLGVRVAATDTLSGVRFVRFYMGSDAQARTTTVRLPFWNANLGTGGLIQLPIQGNNNTYTAEIRGGVGDVLVPVLDPTNESTVAPNSPADILVIVSDHAGNANASFRRVQVRHTDELDNGVDGSAARLRVNFPIAGEHEIQPVPISDATFSGAFRTAARSTTLPNLVKYAGFYGQDNTPLPYDDPNNLYDLPSYLAAPANATVYNLLQVVNTLPYKLVLPNPAGVFGVLFNNYGHMEAVPTQ
ncbi:carboxypeptidase-like regulatory domain-containing protein [Thermus sp.]|uniref:carboxypeptidase-like regulatory domain-containing protein n=1 Tax=Thermus sp. TaxID=275 RepID=UPI00344A11C5